jgi:lipopolysaccharide export system protein LptA
MIFQWMKIAVAAASGVAAMGVPFAAHAERADRAKPVVIEYDRLLANIDASTVVVEGNVILEQGTLRITAPKMNVKSDAEKNVFAELIGNDKQRVTFREKREGFNDYTEGEADRAEYDQRANSIKLMSRARITSAGSEITGDQVFYNSVTEEFKVDGVPNSKPGTNAAPQRGRLVLPPPNSRDKPNVVSPAQPAPAEKK